MIGRLAIVALAVSLAGCAGMEPAGRNARSGPTVSAPAPVPVRSQSPAPLPPPQPAATTPPPQSAPLVVPQPTAPVATTTPAAPPAIQRTQPPAQAPQAPPVAAPRVSVPTPPPPQPASAQSSDDDDIVVPGQVRTQVPPPAGDPRTNEERRADVRAWDQCVTQVQSAFDADPMRPQLTTPEEYCAQSLGMPGRTSVPISRRQRR